MPLNPWSVESSALSDIGMKRTNNEDVFTIDSEAHFYALADGMGGHQAGEVAARLAAERLVSMFIGSITELETLPPTDGLLSKLAMAVQEANTHVHQMAASNQEWTGMGTTLSCAFFHDKNLFFAHVGDSRIYRYRQGRIVQLTEDHSLRKEAPLSPRSKHKLTRAIGTSHFVEPEIGMSDVQPDDFYLICSDGLTDHVPDEQISSIFHSSTSLPSICEALVEAAKNDGGFDNITVVVIKILETTV